MNAGSALITGLSGQDGSYLAELLLDKGYAVHGLVRGGDLGLAAHLYERLTTHEGDVRDADSLVAAVAAAAPTEIYHLAAVTAPGDSWERPEETFDVVASGTVRLLDAALREAPRARTFVASSAEVFGALDGAADETAPFAPRNPYGAAKAAAAAAARAYRNGRGMWISTGFLYNHESPRRPETFVTRKVSWHAAAIACGSAPELRLGSLEAQRDWGYAPEYVEGAWRALQAQEPGEYVFATGELHTVGELVATAFARAGVDPERYVVLDDALARAPDDVAPRGDADKARRELGWRPEVSFEQLVGLMVDADLKALRA